MGLAMHRTCSVFLLPVKVNDPQTERNVSIVQNVEVVPVEVMRSGSYEHVYSYFRNLIHLNLN